MFRSTPSVVFAVLLLLAQLLFGVMFVGAAAHGTMRSCDGCPSTQQHADPTSLAEGCGTHCGHATHGGSPPHPAGCGTHCTMAGSVHCGGFPGTPALSVASGFEPELVIDSFRNERLAVELPDSPLFDFLRPPAHA